MTDATRGQIVFTEIPASDPERACKFYETLLQGPLTKDDNGPNPIWMLPHAEGGHAAGHIYPGQPAKEGNGMTAHLAVIDGLADAMERVKQGGGEVLSEVIDGLADAMERVKQGGGEVLSEVIDIPIGSFFYAKDTEGNSLGLFKYNN